MEEALTAADLGRFLRFHIEHPPPLGWTIDCIFPGAGNIQSMAESSTIKNTDDRLNGIPPTPLSATELRKQVLWLNIACFSRKCGQKQIGWTGRQVVYFKKDRNGYGSNQKWAWLLKVSRTLCAR